MAEPRKRQPEADVIVVLGSKLSPDGGPTPSLKRRVAQAVRLFSEGRAENILLSGGVHDHPTPEAEVMAAMARDAGIGAGARPCRRSSGGEEVGQRPRRHFDGLFGQAKVDVDAFANHFDKFGQHPAPEAKAYAIRENDGASLSMGHFKQTETLLPLLVIRRPIAAMIVADETDGLVVADDAPRQDMGIGRTSVGLGGRR